MDRSTMLAFEGTELPSEVRARLAEGLVPGITLFARNVVDAGQLRWLTDDIQAAGREGGGPPLLVAMDQEGGQLMGLGSCGTPFPGNMALGATGDPELVARVGRAIGRELLAVGINVNLAPVCDVATDPANPSLGVRSFGDDPVRVATFAAALVRGLQAEGVAATLKHFPGQGTAGTDPHHELPVLDCDRERMDVVELVPFRAGIAAGARLVMVGHCAVPGITGRADLPASLAPAVIRNLLRNDLGFDGVVITDALDMRSVRGRASPAGDVMVEALRAGADLLLTTPGHGRPHDGAADVTSHAPDGRSRIEPSAESEPRVIALRRWLGAFSQPDSESAIADHPSLAREVAERSITLVRNDEGLIPLRLPGHARIAAVMPGPRDLTPADTSSSVRPGLAGALRRFHPHVDEFVTVLPPEPNEIADLIGRIPRYDLLVIGTIAAPALPSQSALVEGLGSSGVPMVTVSMRTPFDLASYPSARTHLCTYSILGPSMDALARALFGRIPLTGRLPTAIGSLYPTGYGRAG